MLKAFYRKGEADKRIRKCAEELEDISLDIICFLDEIDEKKKLVS